MKDFFNKYFSKELLERYGLSATLIGTLSILYGVIYQYNSLSYTELSFFSWTQSINDGVKILPVTISMFLFGFLGYEIIFKIFYFTSKVKCYIPSEILNILIQLIISIGGISLLYNHQEIFTGNILGVVFAGLSSLLLVILVFSIFYLSHIIKTNKNKKPKKNSGTKWLQKNGSIVIFIIIFLTLLNSFSFIFNVNQSIDKHNCFIHDGKIFQLKYMNDKYIFTDIYIQEKLKLEVLINLIILLYLKTKILHSLYYLNHVINLQMQILII